MYNFGMKYVFDDITLILIFICFLENIHTISHYQHWVKRHRKNGKNIPKKVVLWNTRRFFLDINTRLSVISHYNRQMK